jgi:8-oxo-dGTP pyrophosphatase MutT (NUDIX family)
VEGAPNQRRTPAAPPSTTSPLAVPVRHAATVIVLRDGAAGPEVLMLRRSATASFLPGAYVFPGGVVDEIDREPEVLARLTGLSDESASALLGVPRHGLAFWVAAVRECFEESGLFLASTATQSAHLARHDAHAALMQSRTALLDGHHTFRDVMARHDAQVLADSIVPWSRWVTPIGGPRRFDTRFFVTAAHEASGLSADDREMSDLRWFGPEEALNDPDVMLITPTLSALRMLQRSRSVADAISAAKGRLQLG